MKRFTNILLITFLGIQLSFAQNINKEAYIISVDGNDIYLDLKSGEINVGDMLKVTKEREFMIHPVSKDTIWKKIENISNLTISQVENTYSVAKAYPLNSINLLKVGMKAHKMSNSERQGSSFKKKIMVQSINIAGSIHGEHLGLYLGDLLTEQLFGSEEFKIVDRTTLNFQLDEINLSETGVLNEKDKKKIGSTMGVDYIIVGTAYPPDVAVKSTGVPLKSILSVAELVSGENLGSKHASNIKTQHLEAIVKISLRIVNVKTGEIEFICTEMRKAEGKSDLRLEGGAMNGLALNGGVTDFLNTVSGQASQQALKFLTKYIIDFFRGNINEKNYQGNIIDIARVKGDRSAVNSDLNIDDDVFLYDSGYNGGQIFSGIIYGLHSKKSKVQIKFRDVLFSMKDIYKKENDMSYQDILEFREIKPGTEVLFYQFGFKDGIIIKSNSKTKNYDIKSFYIDKGITKDKVYFKVPFKNIKLIEKT